MLPNPNRVVLFCTPSYTNSMSSEFTGSLARAAALLTAAGVGHVFSIRGGNCFIDVVRNLHVADFLAETQYTDLFFIDDDVGFEAEKVVEFVRSTKDVICGVYPKKNDAKLEFPAILKPGDDEMPIRDGHLVKATLIPAGFVRIRRHVLERLAQIENANRVLVSEVLARAKQAVSEEDAKVLQEMSNYVCPHYEFFDVGHGERVLWNIFDRGPRVDPNQQKGTYWGEDSMFTKKVIDAGFDIWIDPSCYFSHRGSKKWVGKLDDSLALYVEQTNAKHAAALAGLKAVA